VIHDCLLQFFIAQLAGISVVLLAELHQAGNRLKATKGGESAQVHRAMVVVGPRREKALRPPELLVDTALPKTTITDNNSRTTGCGRQSYRPVPYLSQNHPPVSSRNTFV